MTGGANQYSITLGGKTEMSDDVYLIFVVIYWFSIVSCLLKYVGFVSFVSSVCLWQMGWCTC